MLTRAYVEWLESLPCNRSARRRYRKHGQWLEGWVSDQIDNKKMNLFPPAPHVITHP